MSRKEGSYFREQLDIIQQLVSLWHFTHTTQPDQIYLEGSATTCSWSPSHAQHPTDLSTSQAHSFAKSPPVQPHRAGPHFGNKREESD